MTVETAARTSARDRASAPDPAGSRREPDPAPPQNPVGKVVRDVLFNVEHASRLPPGVPWRKLGFQLQLMRNPVATLVDCHRRFGGVFTVPAGPQLMVMVTAPEAIREIQVDKADAFNWRGGAFGEMSALLGLGILTSDGELHDRARRLMDPAFHRARMEEHLALIFAEAAAAVDALEPGAAVDVNAWARDLTMRIAMRALVGFDESQEATAALAAEHFETALAAFGGNFGRLLRGPGSAWHAMQKSKKVLEKIVADHIAVTRARPEPGADLVSILVETTFDDGSSYTDEEIASQVMTLLFAGHDTTSSTLAFLMYELARNSTIQDGVRAQIREIAGRRAPGTPLHLGFGDLMGSIPRLSTSIDETLRLYPPVWIGARQAARDVTIGGHRIPAGTPVNYLPWITHHLPELWDDPESFRPDRFTPENRATIPQGAYVPFGGGARICLGQRFGLTVSHAVAATLLGRFRMETTPDTRLKVANTPTLTPVGGLMLRPTQVP
ncbi:cytochrome P450 [Gordonia sp. VNK21]|uniref:cytochrome P450 n=1 Tax=Gordonia sp. VNK21 TaxID=3382483 RepID=UPI0038D41BF0